MTKYGMDISKEAINQSRVNLNSINKRLNIEFIQSNILNTLPDSLNKEIPTIIVSNPPYITEKQYKQLDPSVVN